MSKCVKCGKENTYQGAEEYPKAVCEDCFSIISMELHNVLSGLPRLKRETMLFMIESGRKQYNNKK